MKRIISVFLLLSALLLCGCGTGSEKAASSDAPEITIYSADANRFEDSLLPYGTSAEDAYALMDATNDLPDDFSVFHTQFEPVRSLYGVEVITSATFTDGAVSAVSYQPAANAESAEAVLEEAIGWNHRFLELFGEDGYVTQELGTWENAGDVVIPDGGLSSRSAWVIGEPGAQTKLVLTLTANPGETPRYSILIGTV